MKGAVLKRSPLRARPRAGSASPRAKAGSARGFALCCVPGCRCAAARVHSPALQTRSPLLNEGERLRRRLLELCVPPGGWRGLVGALFDSCAPEQVGSERL